MKKRFQHLPLFMALGFSSLFLSITSVQANTPSVASTVTKTGKTLPAFQSEEELDQFFKKELIPLWEKQQKERNRYLNKSVGENVAFEAAAPMATEAVQDSKFAADESITNVQHAGVDEGGIVKAYGDYLVILLRGRLFTVKVNGKDLVPVAAVNAYGDDIEPSGTWYDEMLVSGNNLYVIGYSYARGGTEIGWFNIDQTGQIQYRSTYHLRSNDYYSSRNYASRLVEGKLVFYSGMPLNGWAVREGKYQDMFPAMRKWHKGAKANEFKTISSARRVYKPLPELAVDQLTMHNVTTCEVVKTELECKSSVVMGPYGHVFYVSPQSVYVWTTASYRPRQGSKNQVQIPESILYRLPLNGSAPSALKTRGSPIDQMSFLESNNRLHVLVDGQGLGDGMWRSEQTNRRDLSLLRISLNEFGDGSTHAKPENYMLLARPEQGVAQNRYVGDYLLYGSQNYSYSADQLLNRVFGVRWKDGQSTHIIDLGEHGVERIEAMGRDAVIIGGQTGARNNESGLYFTSLSLSKDRPMVASSYKKAGAAQSESRSHGFFYKAENANKGIIGLPVVGYSNGQESAAMTFLSNQSLHLSPIGDLNAQDKVGNDNCVASCVDWYGNSRPIFYKGRIFALMGYEIVEGMQNVKGQIVEKQRVNFKPQKQPMVIKK